MDRRLPEREMSALRIIENSHLTEDALEAYSLGRLSLETDLEVFEEHLLVCAWCQSRQEKMDAFVLAAKDGAQAVIDQPSPGRTSSYLPAAIAAGAVGLLLVPAAIERYNSPADLELVAVRNITRTEAPAGRNLNLKADLTGLPAGPLRWELVSANGDKIAEGPLTAGRLSLSALATGQYWVRLRQGEVVVREFSLSAR